MKKQKVFALLLASALVFSVSTFATAADTLPTQPGTAADKLNQGAGKTDIKVGSTLLLPTIDVSIKKPVNVVVNPYQMEYTVNNGTPTTYRDSLISFASGIENHSTIPVTITGTPTAKAIGASIIDFLGAKPADDATFTEATAYMTLEMAVLTSPVADGTQTLPSPAPAAVVTTNGSTSTSIELAEETSGTPGYGAYLLKGGTYGTKWDNADLFEVNLAFDKIGRAHV